MQFDNVDWDEQRITRGAFTLTARICPDETTSAPWAEHDGHGPVTKWVRRNKRPSELVLNDDQGARRFYDFQEACKIARRDAWGAPGASAGMTRRQIAAHAARADFERLRAWCENEWVWVWVEVRAYKAGVEVGYASLGGIASDEDDYLAVVANGLIEDALTDAKSTLALLAA